jgi:hypothetical protein
MRLGERERGRGPARTTFALCFNDTRLSIQGSPSPANGLLCGCEQAHRAPVKNSAVAAVSLEGGIVLLSHRLSAAAPGAQRCVSTGPLSRAARCLAARCGRYELV